MISYDRLLHEMSNQLEDARKSASSQKRREALVAIRSLCEVGLGQEGEEKTIPTQQISSIRPVPELKSSPSLESRPLDEEDANGESIFDF